ncbi:MAG: post-COAP-1 domain-containing protein [Bacillota bacterium]
MHRPLALFAVLLGLDFLAAPLALSAPTTPASATLTATNGPLAFSGGPDLVSNPTPDPLNLTGGPVCSAVAGLPQCDNYILNLDAASLQTYVASNPTAVVDIFLGWTSVSTQGDYDLWVYDQNGNLLSSSGNSGDIAEDVKLPLAQLLTAKVTSLNVTIVAFTADGSAYNGTVSLQIPPVAGGGGGTGTIYTLTTSPAGVPRYQVYYAPDQFNNFQNEPSLGIDWRTGATLFSALQGGLINGASGCAQIALDCGLTLKTTYNNATSPAIASWTDITFVNQRVYSVDPILFTFSGLGRTISTQLEACGTTAISDNNGASWTPSEGCGFPTFGADHETVGGGAYSTAVPLPVANPLFPFAVYYCSQDLETAFCARSDDGGLTFTPGMPISNAVASTPVSPLCTASIHGHVKVSPTDGTVVVPQRNCGSNPGMELSKDDGNTWTVSLLPDPVDTTNNPDPSVGFATDGTLYFAFQGQDKHLHVAVSHDDGTTWVNDQDVSGPFGLVNTTFPETVAGDPNRAAVAFLGSITPGDYQSGIFPGVFNLYIATTYDGGATWTVVETTPNVPVQAAGGVCNEGDGCSTTQHRNLLDFNDAGIDSHGNVVVAFAQGCIDQCMTNPVGSPTYQALPAIAYQSGGKPLFAKYDPAVPTAPKPPLLVSAVAESGGSVQLIWDAPDDGDSALTGYVIARGTASGGELKLATIPASGTRYLDSTATAGVAYFYTVAAVNAVGQSAPGNELKSVPPVPAPSPCVLPGVSVASQPPGSQLGGAGVNEEYDITGVSFAEPYNPNNKAETLVITVTVDNLSALPALPPNSFWKVYFSYKAPGAAAASTFFVDMDTSGQPTTGSPTTGTSAAPEFLYGVQTGSPTGGTGDNSFGSIQGAVDTAHNTITFVLPASLLLPPVGSFPNATPGTSGTPPTAGSVLSSIQGKAFALAGAAGTGFLETMDTTPLGSYTLVGNLFCAPNIPPAAALAATPNQGVIPLAVSFDASGSHEPAADNGVDTIASYSFSFGDGSATVTQSTPTTSHTYTVAGNYSASVTVTNSRGATGTASAEIEAEAPSSVSGNGWIAAADGSGRHVSFGFSANSSVKGSVKYNDAATGVAFDSNSIGAYAQNGECVTFSGSGTLKSGGAVNYTVTTCDNDSSGGGDSFGIQVSGSASDAQSGVLGGGKVELQNP